MQCEFKGVISALPTPYDQSQQIDMESLRKLIRFNIEQNIGNDSNLLIVFYVQIMPDDFVMQLHRF
ncbi:N-acetylneuraminate lyase 2 [Escherichia coli HVH 27 (4-7449267)]|nr:N-acetylneuraminate lyase 2 [Escherichia coli HVH 27 (4-7449267)]